MEIRKTAAGFSTAKQGRKFGLPNSVARWSRPKPFLSIFSTEASPPSVS